MREHAGESGTSMKTPGNDLNPHCEDDQHFSGDPRGDAKDDWMTGGGRGRRRAMMAMMMRDPSGMAYGMHHGRFGFGGRGGGGHGGWFGFGRRGRGFGGRYGGGHGGSSESSSSSSSSESDDEQHALDDDVQGQKPHDSEMSGKEGKSIDQNQQETTKSDAAEGEKDQPSSDKCCNHGYHGRRHGRGHHKHHHGKHMNHHHHHHHHHKTPHHHGCDMPSFPPMHHPHHDVPHCHGNRRHMAKKFFKRSMKKWYKAEKRAWKQQQGDHRCHRVQRSDGDEAVTSGCDNDDDIANPEIQGQLPPPWFFFSHDHHGCGHGRRGKKGKKHGKQRRQCNCERPGPAEDTTTQAATDNQVDVAEEVEILDDDQTPMDDVAE